MIIFFGVGIVNNWKYRKQHRKEQRYPIKHCKTLGKLGQQYFGVSKIGNLIIYGNADSLMKIDFMFSKIYNLDISWPKKKWGQIL